MEQQEDIFKVTVQINEGMEPTALTVIAGDSILSPNHELVFRITPDEDSEQLAVIMPDAHHYWRLVEGEMEQQEVALIGAAIDAHYA